ncbi:MAG: hypothetical protein ACJ77Z_11085 [Thermoleophilaceae bacterium]|jgi:hypothetical protein
MARTQESILYIETDIRPGLTFSDYRRARVQHVSRRRLIGRLRVRRANKSR